MDCHECCVCFRPYDENYCRPCMLQCGHSFCVLCLNRIFYDDEDNKICPTCRQKMEGFRMNYALITLANLRKEAHTEPQQDFR